MPFTPGMHVFWIPVLLALVQWRLINNVCHSLWKGRPWGEYNYPQIFVLPWSWILKLDRASQRKPWLLRGRRFCGRLYWAFVPVFCYSAMDQDNSSGWIASSNSRTEYHQILRRHKRLVIRNSNILISVLNWEAVPKDWPIIDLLTKVRMSGSGLENL